jgi:ribosomal protein L35AE/L33A
MVRSGLFGLLAIGLIASFALAQEKSEPKTKNVKIVHVETGKVLSVADSSMDDEAAAVLVKDEPVKDSKDAAQQKKAKAATWKLDKDGDHWKVTNRNSGKVLDVSGDSKDDGTIIIQYNDKPGEEGNDNQRWAWVEIKTDDAKPADAAKADASKAAPTGRIKSKSSSLVLDADSDGTVVQRSANSKAKSQIWQIVEIKE